MKWKTHIAIAKAISKSLYISKDLERSLSQGSIEPDKYEIHTSHHHPELRVIMNHIWDARLAYLNGDFHQTTRSLGRALHYVQDKSVYKGYYDTSHDTRENDLCSQKIPTDAIWYGLHNTKYKCSPYFCEKIIENIKPKENSSEIIYQACLYSAVIIKTVIGEKTASNELIEDFKSSKKRYYNRTIPLSIGVSGLILTLSIIQQSLLLLPFGILAGYIVQKLDFKYHYLKKEVEWFGVK